MRLAVGYAGLIFAAFVFAGVMTRLGVRRSAENEVRQSIELEVHAIETEIENEGLDAAVAAIKARSERPGAPEYRLTDEQGAPVVGDLAAMDGANGWRVVELPAEIAINEDEDRMLVLTKSLKNGARISVGEDLGRAAALERAVLRTLFFVGGVAVIASLLAGVLLTRRALSRMDALNATMKHVAAGDLSARFPSTRGGPHDDLDEIGSGVNAMLIRIEELVDGLRRVSRDVAHELKTPLSHLRQRLEQAKTESDAAEREKAIDAAQDKVGEILKTFEAILRLSEIEAGAARRRFGLVDLSAVVERVADAYRPDIEESGGEIVVDAAERCPVLGDEELLAQALANLVENAMRHAPRGVRIRLGAVAGGDTTAMLAADDGPGVPAAAREAMLKPFARMDASRAAPGSGLGLSIVAAIAKLHGADLLLEDARPGLKVSLVFKRAPGSLR